MKITDKTLQKLRESWGDKAEAMQCYAELRLYDPSSSWVCYVYAVNPDDDDECMCIVKVSRHNEATIERWYLTNIFSLFNQAGEGVEIDREYRPQRAAEIFKKLNEEKDGY